MTLTIATPEPFTLTAADRCDAKGCGARAYVRVTVTVGLSDILLCGHHGNEYRAALVDIVHDYVDETAAILA